MEYLEGGDLFHLINQSFECFNQDFIRKLMRELLTGVAYLHGKSIGSIRS